MRFLTDISKSMMSKENVLLCSISLFIYQLTVYFSILEFNIQDYFFIGAYISIVILIEIIFITVTINFLKNLANYIYPILFSLFFTLNYVSIYFYLSADFLALSTLYKILITLYFVIIISFLSFLIFPQKTLMNRLISFFIISLCVLSVINTNNLIQRNNIFTNQSIQLDLHSNSNFKKKPNVYLLGIESLIPSYVSNKYFEINELDYEKELKKKDFIIFKKNYSNSAHTREFFEKLISFSKQEYDKWLSIKMKKTDNIFFSGKAQGVLPYLFKINGYKTITHYNSQYLGTNHGQFIDEYQNGSSLKYYNSRVCEFIYKQRALLGGCDCLDWVLNEKENVSGNNIEYLLNKIEESFDSESPVLFISHLLISFHTPNYYNYYNESDYNNFLQSYKLSVPKTSDIINIIVSKIIEEDPNCLIYIFGDHGLHASRGIDHMTPNFDLLKFSVLDRFGAFGALYTNDYLYKQVINKYINESKSTNHIDNISQILKYLIGHNPVLGKTNNSLESDMYPGWVIDGDKFY